ncbi:uncharacterized protein LOC129738407 [Uranotaenia lowii]|uniref:uncharacterized protein LOC129738407 n=1 Tax=Uranotaenia lowii TaxID=190385 RepID=UPI002478DABB|nr:uncharacterized protein LOC129738407 [Uranotaenia lowii]XP_055585562.1 uncharacterized protein LOC129738407 [Uranotaenia lowii]XP_055585563.1 uncharacterized protein LOC129738407 [Uranotaenia lowii]
MKWATHIQKTGAISLMDFNIWLTKKVDAFSRVTRPQAWTKPSSRNRREEAFLHVHSEQPSVESTRKVCLACAGDCANIESCSVFLQMSTKRRWALKNEHNFCRKCLAKHLGACERKIPCNVNGCRFLHHSLLHDDRKHSGPPSHPTQNSHCNTHNCSLGGVLLKYIRITVHGKKRSITTYAFLDGGSTCTLMEHSLWQDLDLAGEQYPLCINWTAGQGRYEAGSVRCSIDITGSQSDNRFHLTKVHTVESLALPPQTVSGPDLINRYRYLSDVPIDSYTDIRPRILLGMDNIRLEYPLDSREGLENQPTAVLTRLGWVIFGPNDLENDQAITRKSEFNYHVCQCDELNAAVRDYFSFDSLGVQAGGRQILSKDDERAMALLKKNTTRNGARYETCLLWRYDNIDLPSSKNMALSRHKCLERRLIREPELAKALQQKVCEYETKGYIRMLTAEEENMYRDRCWYLPIFPVTNPNKPGKLRIVWDAAAKVGKVSLNSFLLKGPDQVVPLPHVLRRFREYRVGITGDIREMFHQVRINNKDQHYQRFFWNKGNFGDVPATYVMEVMTFGASCSPSCAQYVKNLNAIRFREQYPLAADEIKNGTYVDDMLCSVESEVEAIELAKNVRMIHASGGFEIRGWLSNSRNVMEAMGESDVAPKNMDIGAALATEKVLGMWWDTISDTFTFKTPKRCRPELMTGSEIPTKREVLRVLMLIYDPLGFLANFLMYLKVLLQEIWRSGVQWDEPINEQQFEKWCVWLKVLQQVENVSIPRCYRTKTSSSPDTNHIQIHVFVDASENGYAAVVYLRFEEDSVECAFVTAKTRVAPLKYVSIPRLELQAAVIGARLAQDVVEQHRLPITQRFFWSDSRDVLCWLKSDHRKYTKYIGARVGEILEKTNVAEWNWVPSKLNVADEGTKWQKTPDLHSSSRWFRGPDFIWQSRQEWPEQLKCYGVTDTEILQHSNVHVIREPLINFGDHSNWWKLVRLVAFIRRYIGNLRQTLYNREKAVGMLKQSELLNAEYEIYRMAQREEFREEISLLSNTKNVNPRIPKTSVLYGLSPFLDEYGVLRMKSRISNCRFIDQNTAHPILLSKNHQVTNLVAKFTHEHYHHLNHETVVNELRQKYHIPKLRRVCNKIHRDCQACKNAKARPQSPMMADLPPARLAACSRPFSYIGIDYFGPMNVAVGRRVEKRWGVLITCLVVRAVHLEIAHSLTASSCIMAIRNFIARRGTPIEIFSDRGTNFVGSSRELSAAVQELDQDKVMKDLVSADTKWTFLPPSSPHMGGSWERLVQSVKKILNNMNLPRTPTDEVLRNSLLEIEFIINSRPLTYIPIENASSEALTPNHFLLGSSHGLKPLVSYHDSLATLRNTWKTSQVYANLFWKRWLKEYLPTIRRRPKWHHPVKPIAVGDVVVIVDSDLPRNLWPKGRVVKVNEHAGQVRSATVRTLSNVYERPAVKLAVLDIGATECKPGTGSGLPGGSVTSPTDAPQSRIEPPHHSPSLTGEKRQGGKVHDQQ